MRELREGRGSPHAGVFLDIAWIRRHLSDAESHIKRKLPGMYHQFKELAGIDITKEPMEVGPTTHYVMDGVRVDADTQMSAVPGLFAAGECGAGLHGANRLGGNSLSDLVTDVSWDLDVKKRIAPFKPRPTDAEDGTCCTAVCPENITITDNAIIPLKERVVDRFYDPVKKLLRMLRP